MGSGVDGAGNVWVDHCSFNTWSDGALDITNPIATAYTDVTVSWCKFSNHNKVMLIGAAPGDVNGSNMKVHSITTGSLAPPNAIPESAGRWFTPSTII